MRTRSLTLSPTFDTFTSLTFPQTHRLYFILIIVTLSHCYSTLPYPILPNSAPPHCAIPYLTLLYQFFLIPKPTTDWTGWKFGFCVFSVAKINEKSLNLLRWGFQRGRIALGGSNWCKKRKKGKFWIFHWHNIASLGILLIASFILTGKMPNVAMLCQWEIQNFPFFVCFASIGFAMVDSPPLKPPRSRFRDFSWILATGNEQNPTFQPIQSMNQQAFDLG